MSTDTMIRAGLVGVTGYTGMELARLMVGHPAMELVRVTSRAEAGKTLAQVHPFVARTRLAELVVTQPDVADLKANCDVVFLAIPHGAAMDMAGELFDAGVKVVDLSADFRINNAETYTNWYAVDHRRTDLLEKAVYGLPELNAEAIAKAQLIANPGCYPTSAIFALYPALSNGLVEPDNIVIDSKSGTSGAGRKASVGTLFCEVADTFRAYNLGKHRHTPEIEQEISRFAGRELVVSFNTHLLPINRGILSTCYTKLLPGKAERVREAYEKAYADDTFIRVLPEGALPETRFVRGTMFCDIGLVIDPRTDRLIVVSAIDNVCRGASGQALANANLMCGLPMQTALELAALIP